MKPLLIRKNLALSPQMVREIDDYRFNARIRSETEAMRALLRDALDRAAKRPPPASRRTGSAA